ncbi:MAG: alpha-ketoacid dehydrogenase subunit beta [Youngiibacter sp.]|jgi:pyruvate dehydrogenase E1 component beta subunit|nr:alpha-ketoacid dehydrogenase subunit beta [Youngiibacter sp.]
MREITYMQALQEAHMEEMKRDENIFLMGIELRHMGSGIGQTAGVFKEFGPDRVFDTPISESGYVGTAVGLALGGVRTIVEVQFADFLSYAFDSIVNQAAKMRYLSDGKVSVPLVIRAPQGMGFYFGAQHSQCVDSWFMNAPGLKIAIPSNAYDAKGLLKTAIRDDDPVLFLEHKACIFTKSEVPEEEYLIPFGQAKVVRPGTDVTIVAMQKMVWDSMEAAEELQKEGINVEVIDPRTLIPLDKETIFNSVKKTGKVVIVNESPLRGSVSGEISSLISDSCFTYLKAPIKRVGAANIPIPFGANEVHVLPNKNDIIAAVKSII